MTAPPPRAPRARLPAWVRLLIVAVTLTIATAVALGAGPAPGPVSADMSGQMASQVSVDPAARTDEQVWFAFGCVVITFVLLIGVILLHQVLLGGKHVGTYRTYEQELLRRGDYPLQALLDYHSLYHWGDYAAVTLGMVLVSVTLITVDGDKLTGAMLEVQLIAIFTMIAAAVLLVFADLMHTNTQTPIIPLRSRFDLIDWSVRLGTMGTLVTVLAALFFVAIIDTWLTLAGCGFFLGTMILVYSVRRLPKAELAAYFRVDLSDTAWPIAADRTRARTPEFQSALAVFDAGSLPYRPADPTAVTAFGHLVMTRLGDLKRQLAGFESTEDAGGGEWFELPPRLEAARAALGLTRREAHLVVLESFRRSRATTR